MTDYLLPNPDHLSYFVELSGGRAERAWSRFGIFKNPKHQRSSYRHLMRPLTRAVEAKVTDLLERKVDVRVGFPMDAKGPDFRITFWGTLDEWVLIRMKFL